MFERIPVQDVTSQSGTFGCATSSTVMDCSAVAMLIVLDAVLLLESSSNDDDTEEIDMYAMVTSAHTGSRVCRIQGYRKMW